MKKFFLIILTISIITIPSWSFSAWWYEKYVGQGKTEISDDEFQFKAGDITCVVSKTDFTRMPDDTIDENRLLTCSISQGTKVTVRAHCNYPLYSLTDIVIEKKGKMFWPALYCGPKKQDK